MRHGPHDRRRAFPPHRPVEGERSFHRHHLTYGREYDDRHTTSRPRRPWELPSGGGYRGPGELGRYGNAPVPYGPDHTYDYHRGESFGYGPDFRIGEERIGHRPAPHRPPWRRRRR